MGVLAAGLLLQGLLDAGADLWGIHAVMDSFFTHTLHRAADTVHRDLAEDMEERATLLSLDPRFRRAVGERDAIDATDIEAIRFVVADTGRGIAQDDLERIFAQGYTTKEDASGFGLHISALAAREIGGDLSARSAGPGRGAVFTLVVPTPAEPRSRSVPPVSKRRGARHGA